MPLASDIILDWIAKDGYSLSETGWIRPQDRKFYFEVAAEKDGHRHIARARDREQAVVNLRSLKSRQTNPRIQYLRARQVT